MAQEKKKIRRQLFKIEENLDALEASPVPKDAPELYSHQCIKIYGNPAHRGGDLLDTLYIEHVCRDDLGVVMLLDGQPLHAVVREFVAGEI